MNDEQNLSDEQLQLATSRKLPLRTQLDNDSAAARDAFLSVGASVESTANNFDEAALLARLEKSCLESTVARPKPVEPIRDWLSLLLTGALAAAALIAIVRISADPQMTHQQVAVNHNGERSTTNSALGVAPIPSMIAWNDPLDDELALAAARLEQFGGRRQGFDDSVLNMNEQLQSLSQELLGESL